MPCTEQGDTVRPRCACTAVPGCPPRRLTSNFRWRQRDQIRRERQFRSLATAGCGIRHSAAIIVLPLRKKATQQAPHLRKQR
jgi:hypothetical protein